jgi:hypothetical protein
MLRCGQGRLVEAQQQLERKGQELWEAVASKAGLRKDLEARSSQVPTCLPASSRVSYCSANLAEKLPPTCCH